MILIQWVREPRPGEFVDLKREIHAWMTYHGTYVNRWRTVTGLMWFALMASAPIVVIYASTPLAACVMTYYVFLAFRVGAFGGMNAAEDCQAKEELAEIYDRQVHEDEIVPLNHVMYRLYSEDGELLYIGITSDIVARMAGHRADKYWWTEVCTKRFEYLESRAELEAAERLAIIREKPLYNLTHNRGR